MTRLTPPRWWSKTMKCAMKLLPKATLKKGRKAILKRLLRSTNRYLNTVTFSTALWQNTLLKSLKIPTAPLHSRHLKTARKTVTPWWSSTVSPQMETTPTPKCSAWKPWVRLPRKKCSWSWWTIQGRRRVAPWLTVAAKATSLSPQASSSSSDKPK